MAEKIWERFPEKTELRQYLKDIERMIGDNQKGLFGKKYLPILDINRKKETPCFLSVIIRTQGKRPDGLREAMLCLQAQAFQNFEIILVAHRANQIQKKIVEEIVEDQDPAWRKKILYLELEDGGRAAPINFALAHASGEYAAIYDDDDILFSGWAESFFQAAKENAGRILHCYAFAQNWNNVNALGYRADSAPRSIYCVDYDQVTQLVSNRCPLMTLAFPTYLFQELGFVFDEGLNTTEDWDYFMRMSFLCGVTDIQKPGAIYRFWENLETSSTLYAQNEWYKTYRDIQKGFDAARTLFQPGSIRQIVGALEAANTHKPGKVDARYSQLYYSTGGAFCDELCVQSQERLELPQFDLTFVLPEKRNDVIALRLDLTEEGLFAIRDLNITVWVRSGEIGERVEVPVDRCWHNGIPYQDRWVFLHKDPEIVWEWQDQRELDAVHITGRVSQEVQRTFFLRLLEWLLRFPLRGRGRLLRRNGLV